MIIYDFILLLLLVLFIGSLYFLSKLIDRKNFLFDSKLFIFAIFSFLVQAVLSIFQTNNCTHQNFQESILASGCKCYLVADFQWMQNIFDFSFLSTVIFIILILPVLFILFIFKPKKLFFKNLFFLGLTHLVVIVAFQMFYMFVFVVIDNFFINDWNWMNLYQCSSFYN